MIIQELEQQAQGRATTRTIPAGACESLWHAPDGFAIRRIDWTGTGRVGRGSILFLPGRGEFYEKYLETLDYWAGQGWQVTALDWRGQAGSGRLGADPVTGHVSDFSVWIDDLAAFWQEWRADRCGPCILIAHSMGGHLALRAVAEHRVAPDALVLSAPMLGISASLIPVPVLHGVAWAMTRLGDPRRPAWRWSEKPGELPADRADLLTHDPDRYADELWWRAHRPELVMGPGSWGWVERAFASTRALARPGVLEQVTIPVLILATAKDRLVDPRAIARAVRRLPDCEELLFGPEARHEILRETDSVRDRALRAIDGFLDRVAPQQEPVG
ncbi:putative lipase [Caenibius tardaugens NBRC 16725]|uniref:Putative lipase n=1 Tax=Caenibius tardaugens NBRC 16725 TaxID=1219035 RepID=U3A3V3_9SPHN|nr:alpha/beta hydrolase [Caenibius tardaugens]GAD49433.1 putative lipase [Caenibius tardaugens NBRC 16725]